MSVNNHLQTDTVLNALTTIPVIVTDALGNIVFFNKGAQNQLGYEAGEVVNQYNLTHFLLDFELQKIATESNATGKFVSETSFDILKNNVSKNIPLVTQLTFVAKNEELWQCQMTLNLEERGNYVVMLSEITQIKARKTDLIANHNFLEGILQTTPDVLYVYDLEKDILIYSNRTYKNKYAHEQAPFTNIDNLQQVIHPHDLPRLASYRKGLSSLEKGKIEVIEYRIQKQAGGYAWLLTKDVVFAQNDAGKVTQVLGLARDITDIKEANQKLSQSEALYRAVINTQQEILCRFLPDTTLTFVNEAYCHFFKKTSNELIGTRFLEMVLPENHAGIRAHLKKISEEKVPVTQEYKVMVEDQTGDLWLRWTDYPIFNEQGQLVEFQSVGLEITDRKRVEIELQEQKQMLERILNTLPIHVFIKDDAGKLMLVNQTMIDSLKGSPETFIGKDDYEIFPKEIADKFHEEDELLKTGQLPDSWEEEMVIDGHRHFFRTGKRLIPLPLKDSHYLLGYSFDITPLKETQLQLRESEAKYRLIANNTNDLICLHTYDGRFSYISPAIEGLTGYTEEDMINKKVIDWVFEEDQSHATGIWRNMLKTQTLQILEYRFKHKSGEFVWLETHLFPVYGDAGRLKHVQGNTRNITERKQSEFILKQTRDYLIEVLDHIPDPVFVKNEQYEFVSVNEAYCDLVGKSREDILFKTDYDIFTHKDAEVLRERDKKVFAEDNIVEYQRVVTNTQGEQRYILAKIDVFRDDKNEKVLVGVIRDITKQKKAEAQLANNERSLKAILTSFNDIVFEINQNLIFTNFWGDKEKLFFEDQEFLGKKVTKVLDDPMRSYFASSLRYVLDNKTSKIIEYPSVQNGKKSWYSCTINYLPETSERKESVSVLVTDVTSHKTAQKKLRESEEQLQDFLDNASILIQSVDLDGTIHYVNKYWCKKLGYSKAEALRTNLIDIVVPEEKEQYRELLQQLKTRGGSQQVTTRLITKENKTLMLEGSINIRKAGKPLLTRSFLQDVTERNQAERAILEQNRLFEAFLENSPIGIQIYDKEGYSLQMNDAQKRILGLHSTNSGLGNFNILQDERSQDAGLDFFYKAAYGGESIFLPRLETELVIQEEEGREAKKEVCLNLIIFPIKSDYNEVEGVVTFTQDVSEQFTIEQELNESRYFIKSIADAIPNDVYVYDLEKERYVYTNTQYFKYSGFTIKDVDKGGLDRVWALMHPEDVAEIKAIFKEVAKGGDDMYEMSYRLAQNTHKGKRDKKGKTPPPAELHGKNQTYVWVYDRVVPFKINVEGRVTQILGVVQNITDSKNFEEELIHAKQDAEKALQAKEQFLSTMSHEIRTPMNAVIGITHLLLEEDPKSEQLENLKTLKFSAENLLALINDILDYNKIEAGKISFEKVDFNLREFINNIKHAFSYQAAEKGIELEFYVERDVPNLLIGDPVRLNQILTNLLGNAIKFTDKGFVIVKVQLQEQTTTNDHKEVSLLFSVKDSGIGIAPDKRSTIFERFTQADSDTTRRFGGTGLGLSITKYLIEHQGGEIGLHSEIGKGSEFYFHLHFQISKLKHLSGIISENQRDALSNLGNVVLLLVEDRKINRMVASKFLRRWGIEVDFAYNGEEAVDKVQEKQYDIILMDLLMPKMDGFAAARQIRSLTNYQNTPIIALSASTLSQEREKAFAVQMNDFISKPFNPNELYHKIIKYVNKSSASLLGDQTPATTEDNTLDTTSYYNLTNVDDICQDDQEMRQELIRIFVEELSPAIDNFKAAALSYEPEPMKVVVHNLKSSSMLFGTEKLLGVLNEARELSLNKANLQTIEPLLKNVDFIVQRIIEGLRKEI